MSDPWAGIDAAAGPADVSEEPRRCPWCSTEVGPEASKCPSCGAAVAQRESVGGLVIPGVTSVDPAYQSTGSSLIRSTLRAQQTSASLGAIGQVNQGASVAVAGALLARDYMKGMFSGVDPADVSRVGQPSEAALLAAERLEREGSIDGGETEPQPPDPTGTEWPSEESH